MGDTRVSGPGQVAVSAETSQGQGALSALAEAVELAAKAQPAFVPWVEDGAQAETAAAPWVPASWAKEEATKAELAIELALEAGLRAAAETVENGGAAAKRPWTPRSVTTPWDDGGAAEDGEQTEATERTERSQRTAVAPADDAAESEAISMVEIDEASYRKQLGELASQATAEHYRSRFQPQKKSFLEVSRLAALDLSVSRMAKAVGESIRSFARRVAEYYASPGSVRPGEQAIPSSHLHRGGDCRVSAFEVEPAKLPGSGSAEAWTGPLRRDLLPGIRFQMLAVARF